MRKKILIIGIAFTSFVAIQAQKIEDKILLNYPFNGNANDISGNNIHGVEIGGIELTEDRFGNPNSAYIFDGVDDGIVIPHDTIYKKDLPLSVSMWILADDSSAINQIFKTDNDTTTYYGYNLNSASSNFSSSIMNGAGAGSQYRNTFVSNEGSFSNVWHHVVVVLNGINNIQLYIDGELSAGSYSGTGTTLNYSNSDGALGFSFNQFGGADYYFSGKIDDVMIFDTALSQSDVRDLAVNNNQCVGTYMNFDATDDYVRVDSVFEGADSTFTFEVKFKSLGNGLGLYSRLIGWDNNRMLIAQNTNGYLYTYDGAWRQSNSGDIRDGNWHITSLVIDNDQQRLYLDGRLIYTYVYTGNKIVYFNNTSMWIGSENGPGNENWNGNIKEVRIWDYSRTERQIKENLYNKMAGNESGLISYFDFEQSNLLDSVIVNKSSVGKDGLRGGTAGVNTAGARFINDCTVDVVADVCPDAPYTTPSGTVLTSVGNYVDTVDVMEYYEDYAIVLLDDNCNIDSVDNINKNSIEKINVYPNPTDHFINVDLSENSNVKYELFSITGTQLRNGVLTNQNNRIDVSFLESGIYFLEIESKGIKTISKIVKK